jgi:hypothetical protein
MQEDDVFTEKQIQLVNAIVKYTKLKKAAKQLDISYKAAKQRLYRIRRNYRLAINTLRFLDEIKFIEIIAKIPACQTCKFLDSNGNCKILIPK